MNLRCILSFSLVALSASSDTWEGVEQDSGDIGRKVGETAQQAGEAISEASD